MWVTLSERSRNEKTGPIVVSMTSKDSCPNSCPLKDKECYARFHFLGIVWNRLSEGKIGGNWNSFCDRLKKITPGRLFRYGQAGDLPQTKKGFINKKLVRKFAKACSHLRTFTYTHHSPTKNLDILRELNETMCVNLSANNLAQADEYSKFGLPVVTLTNGETRTPEGRVVVICPNQTHGLTCEKCRLCACRSRKSIVGFLPHGTAKKRLADKISS